MKQRVAPGTALMPVPAVMVSCRNKKKEDNIIAIAWVGIVNSSPPMLSVSIQPRRHSHHMILETGQFVVNVPAAEQTRILDYTGVTSGRDVDKFEVLQLTKQPCELIDCMMIAECPINLECRVKHVLNLGSHDMFVAEIVAVHVEEELLDSEGRIDLEKFNAIVYGGGKYVALGEVVGTAGFSRKQ